MSNFEPVVALTRGLEVLRLLNQLGEASILQLHKETGLHRTTVVRMMDTLVAAGYAARSDDGRSFIPTAKCLQLSNGFDFHRRLKQIAEPILADYRRQVGWPSDLAVLDRDAMFVVSTRWDFGIVPRNPQPGLRAEVLHTALGRAYFAFCEPEERERILKRLEASANPLDRIAADRRWVEALVAEIRAKGYAVADPEFQDRRFDSSVTGFAVPVRPGGRVAASINIVFLRNVLGLEEGVATLLPGLTATAERIAAAMLQDGGFERSAAGPEGKG